MKGVIVIHGLTGSPASMAPLAETLGHKGFRVVMPLLAGHGTCLEDLSKTPWEAWYESICSAYDRLKAEMNGGGEIFLAGLSLGSLLSLKLALDGKRTVKKIACMGLPLRLSPLLEKLVLPVLHFPLIRPFIKYSKKDWEASVSDEIGREIYRNSSYARIPVRSVWEIQKLQKEVIRELPRLNTPTILIHSRQDKVALPFNVDLFCRTAPNSSPKVVWLERSEHVETLDCEKEIVSKSVADFFA